MILYVKERKVNILILIDKYYIYVQRCLKQKVVFIETIRYIEKYKKLEEISARRKGLIEKHKKKMVYV